MEPTDLTIHVLREIRDEIRATNVRIDTKIDELREELRDELGSRIDANGRRIEELGRRGFESEMRTGMSVMEMHGTLREVRDLLAGRGDLRARVEQCEEDIARKDEVGD